MSLINETRSDRLLGYVWDTTREAWRKRLVPFAAGSIEPVYARMTIEELRKLARQNGLVNIEKLDRAELCACITRAQCTQGRTIDNQLECQLVRDRVLHFMPEFTQTYTRAGRANGPLRYMPCVPVPSRKSSHLFDLLFEVLITSDTMLFTMSAEHLEFMQNTLKCWNFASDATFTDAYLRCFDPRENLDFILRYRGRTFRELKQDTLIYFFRFASPEFREAFHDKFFYYMPNARQMYPHLYPDE